LETAVALEPKNQAIKDDLSNLLKRLKSPNPETLTRKKVTDPNQLELLPKSQTSSSSSISKPSKSSTTSPLKRRLEIDEFGEFKESVPESKSKPELSKSELKPESKSEINSYPSVAIAEAEKISEVLNQNHVYLETTKPNHTFRKSDIKDLQKNVVQKSHNQQNESKIKVEEPQIYSVKM
ncbi:hypothetical protein HK096_002068, partial [Nowakowskiella sp. JEL0078]